MQNFYSRAVHHCHVGTSKWTSSLVHIIQKYLPSTPAKLWLFPYPLELFYKWRPKSNYFRHIDLPSLQYRLKREDIIFIYQLLNGYLDIDPLTLFQPTTFAIIKGKLCKPFANKLCHINCLTVRAVREWNDLPQDVVNAESINDFKNMIHEHWSNIMHDCL